MRTRIGLFALAACIAVAVLFSLRGRQHEPRYQGRTLSQLLLLHDDNCPEALAQAGTNALPFLLKWIRYERPAWKDSLIRRTPRKLQGHVNHVLTTRSELLADASNQAFHVLGTNGLLAVAELTSMMYHTNRPWPAIRAIRALAWLGTNGMPALVSAIEDSTFPYPARLWVAAQVALYPTRSDCAEMATRLLIECLGDDTNVAPLAAEALGRKGLAPQLSVPALSRCLNAATTNAPLKVAAAQSLGLFGRDAAGALPSLTNAMTDPIPLVRYAVTNAIRQITSSVTVRGVAR